MERRQRIGVPSVSMLLGKYEFVWTPKRRIPGIYVSATVGHHSARALRLSWPFQKLRVAVRPWPGGLATGMALQEMTWRGNVPAAVPARPGVYAWYAWYTTTEGATQSRVIASLLDLCWWQRSNGCPSAQSIRSFPNPAPCFRASPSQGHWAPPRRPYRRLPLESSSPEWWSAGFPVSAQVWVHAGSLPAVGPPPRAVPSRKDSAAQPSTPNSRARLPVEPPRGAIVVRAPV